MATGQDDMKPDASCRKFIRTHVMKGKNRKRVAFQEPASGAWISHEHEICASQHWTTSLGHQMSGSIPALLRSEMGMEPYMLQPIHDCGNLLLPFGWLQLLIQR